MTDHPRLTPTLSPSDPAAPPRGARGKEGAPARSPRTERGNPGPPDVAPAAPAPAERGLHRRDFLKAAGFTVAGVTSACRRAPREEAVPFLEQPEAVVPGKATWYASACSACAAGCGTLVKTRDGRPVKLEGNPEHPLSEGGLCALGQAAILGLYDSERLAAPLRAGEAIDWSTADREIAAALDRVARAGGRVRLLTGTLHGPTELAAVERFVARLAARGADVRHVMYDGLSSSAILDAHEATHGVRALPRYRFDRADVVVSFDADFLGTWIAPVEHAAGWRKRRDPAAAATAGAGGAAMSHHVQLEGRMSLTGTKADRRVRLLPGEIGAALAHLALRVARDAGADPGFDAAAVGEPPLDPALLDDLAGRLRAARGRSLVVSGAQEREAQVLVNYLNHLLGSYGATLDLERPSRQRRGDDRALQALLAEVAEGSVDALLVRGANPVAELPSGAALAAAMARLPLAVTVSDHRDETARAARYVCPEPHFLETWRDGEPVAGLATVGQPAIRPLADTRPFVESLGAWSGEAPAPVYERVRAHWREAVYPRRTDASLSFQAFWDRAVHDGVALLAAQPPAARPFAVEAAAGAARAAAAARAASRPGPGRFVLALYPKVGILDGRGAENPWLQELPDPVSKVTWGNYASLSTAAARELGVAQGDVVRLGGTPALEPLELPVHVQPGQHDRLVAVALGYGRLGTARFAGVGPRWLEGRPTVVPGETVGAGAEPYLVLAGGALRYHRAGLTVHAAGRSSPLAATQTYERLEPPHNPASAFLAGAGERRTPAREVTLAALAAEDTGEAHGQGAPHPTLWARHEYAGHRWAMAIDLNACTGCSACVVSCQAENNVPVVGRDEVVRRREMHWLRIDRYYRGEGDAVSALHQPMLCQHCDNAPCETVCPVLATVHSAEGLNQQVYNRCVGTRYCANNCPYKVRRFNWFDYPREDRLQNLVLNPDVVVRSRGVMEKCSFCVQRIQEAKGAAKAAGRELADGDVATACEQSCPARAITFGDLADPESRVAKLARSARAYRVLEELNVEPSVTYLAVVRNREEAHGA